MKDGELEIVRTDNVEAASEITPFRQSSVVDLPVIDKIVSTTSKNFKCPWQTFGQHPGDPFQAVD